jgi:peptide/nickel transport system substrate-binding protein
MNLRRVVACVATALLALAACSPVEQGDGDTNQELRGGEAEKGGNLTFALAEEPDVLDPSLALTFVGRIVFSSICEKLYDVNEDLEIIPQLAADLPEISDDGLTVTIPLREGIEFNDGTPFNAEAVKTSLERHISIPDSARASELASIKEIEAVDDTTVRLTLSEPFSPLTAVLADRSGMVMSPTQIEKLGADFGDEPECVGPFDFVERVAQDRIVVEKSKYYYDRDAVNLDGITYRIIIEPNVRVSNLRSGDIDVAERIAPTDVTTISNDSSFQLTEATSLGYQGITVNLANENGTGTKPVPQDTPLAQNPELREAFEMSIDREALNEVVFDGQYVPDCSPISPVSPWYTEPQCAPFDLDQAKQLVEDSGVQTPVPVELIVGNDSEGVRLGEVIQSMAKKAGFDVKVRPTEFTAALEETEAGNYETFAIGWSGRIDPDQNIHQFHTTDGSLNISGAHDPQIDSTLNEARRVLDRDQRKQLYADAIDLLHEERSIIYLYHEKLYLAANADVVGIDFFGDGLVRFKEAGFSSGSE